VSVLQGITAGQQLRQQREKVSAISHGEVATGVVLCTGAGGTGDELAAEILVRILRKQGVEGQHILSDAIAKFHAKTGEDKISVCCVVSITPVKEHRDVVAILETLKTLMPSVTRLGLLIASPFEEMTLKEYAIDDHCEVVSSMEGTVQACLKLLHAYDE
jgi:hypothetical protein